MADTEFLEQLRHELPRLLRDHPEVRHEVWGLMLDTFPSRQEFVTLLEELRTQREETNRRFTELRDDMNQRFEAVDRRFTELRDDMNQRFEAVDQRFEAVDQRFEAVDQRFEEVIAELYGQRQGIREMNVHLSALGGRVGFGLEHMVRGVVEEFAGHTFPFAERLILRDETGSVYGVPDAEVEFDLYAHNGMAYLVEVKSYLKTSDVLMFYRKVQFAEAQLGRQIIPLVLALSMEAKAERKMRELGLQYRVRSTMG